MLRTSLILLILMAPVVMGALIQDRQVLDPADIPEGVTVIIRNQTEPREELQTVDESVSTAIIYSIQDKRLLLATTRDMDPESFLASHGGLHDRYKAGEVPLEAYLTTVLLDLGEEEIVCVPYKDGVCEPRCDNDLDCDCGDGTCQPYENSLTCPADCQSPGITRCSIISDNTCTQECQLLDPDCDVQRSINISQGLSERNKQTALYYIMPSLLLTFVILTITAGYIGYQLWRRRT